VTYVVGGFPADAAGLREGDVILEINGRRMVRKGDYFAALGPVHEPGKALSCKVYRPPWTGRGRGGPVAGHVFTTTLVPRVRDEGPREMRRRGLARARRETAH
jgi:hypothetical protein